MNGRRVPADAMRYAGTLLAAFGGFTASLCAFLMVLSWEHRAAELDFQNRARSFLNTIDAELHSSKTLLATVGAYMETSERLVSRRQYERFVSVLHDRVVGLRNIGWAPQVRLAQRPSFEHGNFPGVGASGSRLFERTARGTYVPARARPISYPILYVQTTVATTAAELRRVRGFDLISEPNRAAAIRTALRTGQPAATRPTTLLARTGRYGGVIAFMPVRAQHERSTANPNGVVFSVFDIRLMIDAIVARRAQDRDLSIALYEHAGKSGRRLIYWRPARSGAYQAPFERKWSGNECWRGTLTMIDQHWEAIVTPATGASWFADSWQAVAALAAGWALTAMIVVMSFISVRRTLVLERMTANLRNTTEDLQRNVEQIAHLARHDALTGLANRTLFRERIEQALARCRRDCPFAVMYLDLDHFKAVNDTLGHDAGDHLLCAVATRICDCLRQIDTIARLGGDEFAIILADEADRTRIGQIADRLIFEVARPYEIDGQRVDIGVSIGIAMAAIGETTATLLLRDADEALYEAKAAGRGTHCFSHAQPSQAQRAPVRSHGIAS